MKIAIHFSCACFYTAVYHSTCFYLRTNTYLSILRTGKFSFTMKLFALIVCFVGKSPINFLHCLITPILQKFYHLKIHHNNHFIPFLAAAHSGPNLSYGYLWSPNVESVFKYSSPNLIMALRKTTQTSSIIAGHPLKFAADLKLQAFSDNTLRVKLDHILFYTDDTVINLKKAHQILGDGKSIRTVMYHTEQTFQQFLTAPFLIHTRRGVVK